MTKMIAIVLLACSCSAADIVLGIGAPSFSGTGTNLVAQWGSAWTPLQLGSSLKLFLVDSTLQSSGSITNWLDSSGNGLIVSNSDVLAQPSVVEINGLKSASFNGTSSFLIVAPFSVSNSVAMFVVAKSDAWKRPPSIANYRKILSKAFTDSTSSGIMMVLDGVDYLDWAHDDFAVLGNGYGATSYPRNIGATSITNGQTCIIGSVLSATQAKSFVNGVETSPRASIAAAVPLSTSGMRICVNAFDLDNQYWQAEIMCILFIQSDLSISDRQKIEGWAAWRYGLQADLPVDHPYKDAAP